MKEITASDVLQALLEEYKNADRITDMAFDAGDTKTYDKWLAIKAGLIWVMDRLEVEVREDVFTGLPTIVRKKK